MRFEELKKEYPSNLFEALPPFVPSGYRMTRNEPLLLGAGLILKSTEFLMEPMYFFFTKKTGVETRDKIRYGFQEFELIVSTPYPELGIKIFIDKTHNSPREIYLRQIEQNIRLKLKRNQPIKKIDCSYIFCTSSNHWLAFVPSTQELIDAHGECEGCDYCEFLKSDEFKITRLNWEKEVVHFDPLTPNSVQEMPSDWKLNSFNNMRE